MEKGGGLEQFLVLGNIAKVSLSLSATAGICKMCSASKVKIVFYKDNIDFLATSPVCLFWHLQQTAQVSSQ